MTNVNMEFNIKFDHNDYIVVIQSTQDRLDIVIEEESNSVYWKKSLDAKSIEELTSKMGSFKSLEIFTKILLCALSKENESISINFCSLNEIQQLSSNKQGSTPYALSNEPESNIKKYLMLVYTQFESVVYPIQLDYFDKTPEPSLLQRTIQRLKSEIKKRDQMGLNNTVNKSDISIVSSSNYPINYTEFERLKTENVNLINKLKILESQRQKGAVDNDDIYKQYSELSKEYEAYQIKSESKIKMLLKSLEELKENQFLQSKNSFHQKDKNQTIIQELESKLDQASEIVSKERKQGQIYIEEKNKQIELMKKEIKALKDNEKQLKVKIHQLEKDLETANKSANYYKLGRTPRSVQSYNSNSVDSKTNSYASNFSKKSATSFLRKNLLSVNSNPYNKYKGLRSKDYKPFSFMNKNKTNIVSNKSKGTLSHKTKSSGGSIHNAYKSNIKSSIPKSNQYTKKPFSKPRVPQASINKGSTSKIKSKVSSNTPSYKKNSSKPQSSFNSNFNNNTTTKLNESNNNKSNNQYDLINVNDRLGKIQSLLNQASRK